MSDKLKPCPFCGGEAEVKKIGNEHCKKMQVKIECSTRGCFAYQQCSTLVKFGRHSWDWLSEHAIAAWNTRTVDAELQAELDAAKEDAVGIEQLKKFAREIIQEECWGQVCDGLEIQERAEKCGLIRPTQATSEDSGEDFEIEIGDTIYKFTDILGKP